MNHMEVWEAEQFQSDSEKEWLTYAKEIELRLGVDLGQCSEADDGYCIDSAYDAWREGVSVDEYCSGIRVL
jgi:hypothetical protein